LLYFVTNLLDTSHLDVNFATKEDVLDYFSGHTHIAFDTETEGFDPYTKNLLSAQFGDAENQFVVDCQTVGIEYFKELLESATILMHNAKFDLRFLYHHNIFPRKVYDSYLAEAVLHLGDNTVRKSLKAVALKYCKADLDKTVRGEIHREGLSQRVIEYAGDDVKYLHGIMDRQMAKIASEDLIEALRIDLQFVKALAYVEYSGFKLDEEKWKIKSEAQVEKLEQIKEELNEWVINNVPKYVEKNEQLDMFTEHKPKCSILWSSSAQVIPLLKDLGVNTKVRDDKTGELKDSAEKKVIKPQKDKSPLIPIYLRYSEQQKLVSTYGFSVLKHVNWKSKRLHTQFSQLKNTGRMSSGGKDPKRRVEFINFQNIPAMPDPRDREEGRIYDRQCFTTEPGNVLIVADYSGQEQIVLANESMDKDLLNFYDQNLGDMHSFVASKIFPELNGLSLREIKDNHPDKRQIAKAAGFAINYGGNGMTIAENLSIPVSQGDAVYEAYFKAFPGLKNYFERVQKATLDRGYVLMNSVSKRKSYIDFFDKFEEVRTRVTAPGFWEEYNAHKKHESDKFLYDLKPLVKTYFKFKSTTEKRALNYPIQGTSADITKVAGIYFFDYLIENNLIGTVKIPNIVHDEIVVEAPENMADKIASKLKESMEQAGLLFCKRVPLKATPHVGKIWEH